MENNENMNNQPNENNIQPEINNQVNVNVQSVISNNPVENNQQVVDVNPPQDEKPKKNNSFLITILILVIVGIGGYFAYTKFIAKENPKGNDNPTPTPVVTPTVTPTSTPTPTPTPTATPTNTQELDNNNNEIVEEYFKQYELTQKVTYKSKDGKKELIIEPKDEDNYAYFNGKKFGAGVSKLGKYLLVEGYEIGKGSQCGDYNYIINLETNTLVDLYTSNLLTIIKLNNNYYFKEYKCNYGDVAIYDENLNKIGTNYIVADKKYFYVLDGNIVKYDADGKIILKSKEVYTLAKYDDFDAMMDETGVYILIVSNGEIFFIDTNVENMKSIKIGTTSEYNYSFGGEGDLSLSPTEDGKININLFDKQNNSLDIVYDVKTKTIQK